MNTLALIHLISLLSVQEQDALVTAPSGSQDVAIQATRAGRPPVLDGRNDDEVWATAPVRSDFRQFEPDDQAAPSLPTEFQVAYWFNR